MAKRSDVPSEASREDEEARAREAAIDMIETEDGPRAKGRGATTEAPKASDGVPGGKTIMSLPRVALSELDLGDDDLRLEEPKDDLFDRLKESMRDEGQLQPIVITRDKKVIVGKRRVQAAKSLGWKDIAYVLQPDNVDQGVTEVMANDTIRPVPLLRLARKVAREYAKMEQPSLRDLGARYHSSHPRMKYLIAANSLSSAVKKKIEEGEVALTTAVKAAAKDDPAFAASLEEQIKTGKKVKAKDLNPSSVIPEESIRMEGVKVRVFLEYIEVKTQIPVKKGQKKALEAIEHVALSKKMLSTLVDTVPAIWSGMP